MIIDCFPFFDELDLLEIRLNELKDVVDVFVLMESPLTLSGKPKPLYFDENKDRYKEFNIVPLIFDSPYPGDSMVMENTKKQFGIDYVFDNFSPGDIMIQSDCDEIPKASLIKEAIKEDWRHAQLSMTLFYYYFNCKGTPRGRNGRNGRLVRLNKRYKYVATQRDRNDKVYHNAGWHFSWMGDIKKKLAAWGHASTYNRPPYNTTKYIEKCRARGRDLFRRGGKSKIEFEYLKDLSYLPQYVLDNMDRFGKYIKNG